MTTCFHSFATENDDREVWFLKETRDGLFNWDFWIWTFIILLILTNPRTAGLKVIFTGNVLLVAVLVLLYLHFIHSSDNTPTTSFSAISALIWNNLSPEILFILTVVEYSSLLLIWGADWLLNSTKSDEANSREGHTHPSYPGDCGAHCTLLIFLNCTKVVFCA